MTTLKKLNQFDFKQEKLKINLQDMLYKSLVFQLLSYFLENSR